jgi:hypothetical protein
VSLGVVVGCRVVVGWRARLLEEAQTAADAVLHGRRAIGSRGVEVRWVEGEHRSFPKRVLKAQPGALKVMKEVGRQLVQAGLRDTPAERAKKWREENGRAARAYRKRWREQHREQYLAAKRSAYVRRMKEARYRKKRAAESRARRNGGMGA